MTVTITPSNRFIFGSKVITLAGNEYVLQDFTITRPSSVTELNGDMGQTIAVVSVTKLEELSGTFVKELSKPDPAVGDEFNLEGKDFFIVQVQETRANGEFATLSFEAKEKLS